MYNISRQTHEVYGNIIHISIEEKGSYNNPFETVNNVKLIKRLWLEEGVPKVRILINNQILTIKEMIKWSIEEYKFLPKCRTCGCILATNVFTHRLCGVHLFCTQLCADINLSFELEKMEDEEDIEFL